ncbi:MAG: hypothetical protein MJ071_05615 [Oscillospiraceae bacterium]|nr:hypothetical protein [Oscillospiraceae bacterium]
MPETSPQYYYLRHTGAALDSAVEQITLHAENDEIHMSAAEKSKLASLHNYDDTSLQETLQGEILTRQLAENAMLSALNAKANQTDLETKNTERTAADRMMLAALTDIIDSGDKNYIPVNSGNTSASNAYLMRDMPVSIPPGTYVFSMSKSVTEAVSVSMKNVGGADVWRVNSFLPNKTSGSVTFTTTDTAAVFNLYLGYSVSAADIMLCRKSAWDISKKFVPYAGNAAVFLSEEEDAIETD